MNTLVVPTRRCGYLGVALAALVIVAVAGNASLLRADTTPSKEDPPPPAPFAFADFSWVPGNAGASEHPLTFGPFTGEFRLDDVYHYSFANPRDNTISGSSEVFRHGEFQVTQLGIGGDILYKNVMGRLMTQFGAYSTTTPRNDASPGRGQWRLDDAYRHLSEAYGGYHIDKWSGVNIQAGIFMSYIGLWSYYNADNWTYQPSLERRAAGEDVGRCRRAGRAFDSPRAFLGLPAGRPGHPVEQQGTPAARPLVELGDALGAELAKLERQVESPALERPAHLPGHRALHEGDAVLERDLVEIDVAQPLVHLFGEVVEHELGLDQTLVLGVAPVAPPLRPPPQGRRRRSHRSPTHGPQAERVFSHTRIGRTMTWIPANWRRLWIANEVSWCRVRDRRFSRSNTS